MINSNNKVIKVVIADDHKLFRDGLKLIFKKGKQFEFAGEAANGKELVELVKAVQPHVILTDIRMPEMDGITAVKHIKSKSPEIGIIALSSFNESSEIVEMLEAGALGYLLKDAGKDEITEAILTVDEGRPYYSNSFSNELLSMIANSQFNPYKQLNLEPELFSKRELDIIQCICNELTNKQISDELEISSRTVEWYRRIIMEKMNVKGTAGIVVFAIKNKLVKI
jgi:DNA-binding NarL/FixJ family response regulator